MNCPACGQPLPEGTTLCPHCGHDSAPAQPASAEPPSGQQLSNPPVQCARCGYRLPQPAGYCPNCGALMNAGGHWPPPPGAYPPGPIPPPRDTGSLVGGFFGGFALSLFGAFLALLGPIVAGILYFVFKQNQPTFARGWGFGILAFIAVLLGLLATCASMIAYSVHH